MKSDHQFFGKINIISKPTPLDPTLTQLTGAASKHRNRGSKTGLQDANVCEANGNLIAAQAVHIEATQVESSWLCIGVYALY